MIVLVYYLKYFINLFPLVEYRDWIFYSPPSLDNVIDCIADMITRKKLFSRDVSFLYVRITSMLAGQNIKILNFFNMLPLGLTCVPGYFFSRQLKLSPVNSVCVILLWAFGLPVIDAVAWQATIHDKFALLFSLICLNASARFLNRSNSISYILVSNITVFILFLLAYNSKESAYFLLPGIMLYPFFFGGQSLKEKLGKLNFLILPICYAVYHNLRYYINLKGYWKEHVSEGSALNNLTTALFHALGFAQVKISGILVISVLLIIVFATWKKKPESDHKSNWKSIQWIVCLFIFSLIITIKTKYQSSYYQYSSRFFLAMIFVMTIDITLKARLLLPKKTWVIPLVMFISVFGNFFYFVYNTLPYYQNRISFSDNYSGALKIIGDHVQLKHSCSLVWVFDLPKWQVFQFYQVENQTELLGLFRFIFSEHELSKYKNQLQSDAIFEKDWQLFNRDDPMSYYIVFDKNLKLIRISYNDKWIYSP